MNTVDTRELRKVASDVYLSCPERAAIGLHEKIRRAADEIDKLRAENELLRSQVTRLQEEDPAFTAL